MTRATLADVRDGVVEVFDWYFSGDVEVHTALDALPSFPEKHETAGQPGNRRVPDLL